MSALTTDASPDPRSYKFILKDISDKLHKRDLDIIKFLCTDMIPASELEKISSGFSVWKSLEDKGYLMDDYSMLADILHLCGRIDLVRTVTTKTEKVAQRIRNGDTLLSPFRVMLCKLGLEIPQSALEGVKFVFSDQLSKRAREDAKDIWKFFQLLEKQDLLAPGHVACLQDVIEATGRPGLQKLVDDYNKSGGGKVGNKTAEFEQAVFRDANWKPSNLGLTELGIDSLETMPTEFYPNLDSNEVINQRQQLPNIQQQMSHLYLDPSALHHAEISQPSRRQERQHDDVVEGSLLHSDVANLKKQPALIHQNITSHGFRDVDPPFYTKGIICHPSGELSAPGFQTKQQPQYTPTQNKAALAGKQHSQPMQPTNVSEEAVVSSLPELPAYKMTAEPRGPCIIINNQIFTNNPDKKARKLEDRPGTKVDEDNLRDTFKKLGFQVFVYTDCTVKRIKEILFQFAKDKERMTKSDAIVVIILSHGKFGAVYGADGNELKIVKILEQFRPDECPALLNKPKLFFLQACQGKEKQKVSSKIYADDVKEEEDDLMPQDADFFIGYATIPGYVSYRHEDDGSWYISTLVEHLNKYARKYDLLSIMTEVNRCVARRSVIDEENRYKQLPLPYTTLTKKVYFK